MYLTKRLVWAYKQGKSKDEIEHFDIHEKKLKLSQNFFPNQPNKIQIAITSGASCPDAIVDQVIQKLAGLFECELDI